MRSKLATVALAGALGITGVVGAALVAPALSYAATGDSTALDDRVASLKDALEGLVSDGTLTQSQADEVATTLAERGPLGHSGRGAEALGLTEDELRTAAQEGTTLAQLAEREGVSTSALVDAMVAAGREHLSEEVTEGELTQAEADAKATELETRITESLDEPLRLGRGHHGGRGGHGRHGDGDGPEVEESTPAPSGAAESDDA
jgi:hypothetical protein